MTIIPGRTTAADQIEIRNRVFQQNHNSGLTPRLLIGLRAELDI